MSKKKKFDNLCKSVKDCTICANELLLGPRPVFAIHSKSKIVVIGQAPGTVVHKTGIPWDDKSGENLRNWMGIDSQAFYDVEKFAIIPMGFCYPGKGKSGDLPPRKECAPQWHSAMFDLLLDVKLILLIGKYAQDYYLKETSNKTLTENVKNFKDYLPKYFVLPHPSPRNNIWQKKNEWFKAEVLPSLKIEVASILK